MIVESHDHNPQETSEWLDSLHAVLELDGPARARYLLDRLVERGQESGVGISFPANTPYVNTIPIDRQPPFPGDRALERRIKSIIRWNAMAMVVRANKVSPGIGGHISTYASAATLFEVGFNHFFRAKTDDFSGDQVYLQGHASPGVYARAFLEGRISETQLINFRRELAPGGGLSSYPHPWLMPDFWEFPTVSMGLSPLMSIYQARFNRYLLDRGVANTEGSRVWAFLGDGEMDEPESLGAITLASREGLNNLIWVVNCNLQRLDGPVRGNGKIIQELEAAFKGAGWNVLKVIWGSHWDPLLDKDKDGLLVRRMTEVVDGQFQKYVVEPGDYTRNDFFGTSKELLAQVEHLTDREIAHLGRGGHDPIKVYSAYAHAILSKNRPTVILAKTVKGYGLGEAGEGRNVSHQQKKMNENELKLFRDRFDIPLTDAQLAEMPFYRPGKETDEYKYLMDRRKALGGFVPRRVVRSKPIVTPELAKFKDLLVATPEKREIATTQAFGRFLATLLRDKEIGKLVVPIVPDEARTFGLEVLFREFGIYASKGQLYEPVDSKVFLYYREAKDGQVLEEGITEAGSMASFSAAGTAYATHGINAIPFFIYYSMFGFQRIGDQIWAHADMRGRGFLLGATAGRTTLAGEGLQHQDGHTHVHASTVPTCQPYDPAFAYELAVILRDGMRRMYQEQESIFYYVTLYNEKYDMPAMPDGAQEGILKGLYKFKPAPRPDHGPRVHLFGSGPIINDVLRAQTMLDADYGVQADVWSATSYTLVRREAMDVDRWNMLHPTAPPRKPYVTQLLEKEPWPVIASSDYMRIVAEQISPWVPGSMTVLGTDGFGRSEARKGLRRFFEVDAECITLATLHRLARAGTVKPTVVQEALQKFGIDPDKPNPMHS